MSMEDPNDDKKTTDKPVDGINELKDEIKKLSEKQDKVLKIIGKRTKIVAIVIPTSLMLVALAYSNSYYFVPTKEIGYGFKSNYEIEDLKGDKINTWVSWKIPQGDLFHIHVQSSP